MTSICAGRNSTVYMAEVVSYDWQSRPFSFVCWDEGADLLRDLSRNDGPDKRQCLKRHLQTLSQATYPCAFAYSYARIRRLVRLGGEFYCGAVADESAIGFSDSTFCIRCISVPCFVADSMSATPLWWLYAGDPRVCRVPITGSLTCVQPPPFCLATVMAAPL